MFLKVLSETVFLASVFDKSEQATISGRELKWLAELSLKFNVKVNPASSVNLQISQ